MGKKNAQSTEAAQAAQPAAEAAAVIAKPAQRIQYSFVKDVDEKQKLAPQALVIVSTIKELRTAPRENVVKALSDGRLKTRQPPERILTYYQKALESAGLIKMEKVAA